MFLTPRLLDPQILRVQRSYIRGKVREYETNTSQEDCDGSSCVLSAVGYYWCSRGSTRLVLLFCDATILLHNV